MFKAALMKGQTEENEILSTESSKFIDVNKIVNSCGDTDKSGSFLQPIASKLDLQYFHPHYTVENRR